MSEKTFIYDENLNKQRYVLDKGERYYRVHWTVKPNTEDHDLFGCESCGYAYQAHQFMNDGSEHHNDCAFCGTAKVVQQMRKNHVGVGS